jgi:hypothetical protein
MMKTVLRVLKFSACVITAFFFAFPTAADLNPRAIAYKLPNQISWVDQANGAKQAVVQGDPDKPGLYVLLIRWPAHRMSRPHFHPSDRFITVLSGTWWVGTGSKYAPETTVPLPSGTFVKHFAKEVHYDGAKDEDTVLEIVGMGPATSTPAETK